MKTARKYIFLFTLLIILLLIPVAYYYPKLAGLVKNPSKFSNLFLSVSGLRAFSLSFLLINIGIFLSAALIDLFILGWQKSAINRLIFKRGKSSRVDLWCWLLSIFSVYDFFTLLFSFGIFYVISSMIIKAGGFHLIQLIPFAWAQFLVVFCLGDLKHYFWHRFMHSEPFWELHKYHHSAIEFNLITTSRGHFLEKGILVVFDSILLSLLGAPLEQFVLLLFIKEFYSQLLHSDINLSLGWAGKYILVSPKAHRLHHSEKADHYDKNFGNIFIFWDRLFGTYASTDEEIIIGVENNQYNQHGFWWDMKEGARAFGTASLTAGRKKIAGANKVPEKIT